MCSVVNLWAIKAFLRSGTVSLLFMRTQIQTHTLILVHVTLKTKLIYSSLCFLLLGAYCFLSLFSLFACILMCRCMDVKKCSLLCFCVGGHVLQCAHVYMHCAELCMDVNMMWDSWKITFHSVIGVQDRDQSDPANFMTGYMKPDQFQTVSLLR